MKTEESKPKMFRQVFIETEADLPKEKDKYFIKYKQGIRTVLNFTSNNHRRWLNDIDWYLQLIEQTKQAEYTESEGNDNEGNRWKVYSKPAQRKNISEIIEEYLSTDEYPSSRLGFTESEVEIIAEKYHAQFSELMADSHALKPSDEDIKMWAETVDIVEQLNIKGEDYLSPFEWAVFAAKAMRDDKIYISPKEII